jgi:hypothetical protein
MRSEYNTEEGSEWFNFFFFKAPLALLSRDMGLDGQKCIKK